MAEALSLLQSAEKLKLWDRYKDLEWVDDVRQFKCVLCQRVAISHWLSNCHHLYCQKCKELVQNYDDRWPCQQCQRYVTHLDGHNMDIEIQVHQLRAFCPNKKAGCTYMDQIWTLPTHLKVCEHSVVENDFLEQCFEKDITDQEDAFSCRCRSIEVLVAQQISNKLMTKVTSKFRAEIDEMKQQIESALSLIQDKQKHLEETTTNLQSSFSCQLKKSECDLSALKSSWDEKYNKQQLSLTQKTATLSKQIEDAKHKAMKRIETTKEDLSSNMKLMVAEIDPAKSLAVSLGELEIKSEYTEVYDWSMKREEWKSTAFGMECTSKIFALPGYSLSAQIQLRHRKNGMVQLYYQWKSSTKLKQPPKIKITPTLAVVLKDQSQWEFKRDVVRYLNYLFAYPKEYDRVTGPICLLNVDKMFSPPYIKDNRIQMKVLVELPKIGYYSNNGVLTWLLDNFRHRKQLEIDELTDCQTSPYFYTNSQGYRLHIRLFLCGWKDIREVCACVSRCNGEHDEALENLFAHKMTVTLFNQVDPRKSKTVVSIKHVLDRNTVTICSQTELLEKGFIHKDSLLLKFSIEQL